MRCLHLSILCATLVLSNVSVGEARENLQYRLSYSGLLTGFFWKKLADVNFNLTPELTEFRNKPACRLSMEIDTSPYLFAELLHPVRYHWESTLSTDLKRTLLARTVDTGRSDVHEVSWYDWENSAISLFRKRKEIDKNRDGFEDEPEMVWEENSYPPPATFIDPQAPIENGLRYLLQTDEFKESLSEPAIDPLAMIQRAQHHPFEQIPELQMLIVIDAELRHYLATLEEELPLKVGSQLHPSTLKIEIARMEENGLKGRIHLWLKNDASRTPLRIDIEAPLGMVHLELHQSNKISNAEICTSHQVTSGDLTSS